MGVAIIALRQVGSHGSACYQPWGGRDKGRGAKITVSRDGSQRKFKICAFRWVVSSERLCCILSR